MNDPTQHKHIYWRSRRGMLELELKLVPFVRDHYAHLAEAEQQAYQQILTEEDWQIFDWLQGRAHSPRPEIQAVVDKIIASQGAL